MNILEQVVATPHLIMFRGLPQAAADKLRANFIKELQDVIATLQSGFTRLLLATHTVDVKEKPAEVIALIEEAESQ
jgi:hypothetical protein